MSKTGICAGAVMGPSEADLATAIRRVKDAFYPIAQEPLGETCKAAISLALSWLNAYEAQAEQGKEENVHGVICSTYQLEGYTDALEKAGLLSREALFRLRARVFAGHQAAIDAIAEKYQLQEVEVKTIFSPSWERITSGSKLH